MKLKVHHFSRYEYSVPVALGRHTLRLVPQGATLDVVCHHLLITPTPQAKWTETDPHGNQVVSVCFEGTTSELCIDSQFEVVNAPSSPIADPGWSSLPWSTIDDASGEGWGTFPGDSSVSQFAGEIQASVANRPLAFLDRLCQVLFERIDRQVRLEGDAQAPEETLRTLRGACRDITVLFLACCRAVGIAGRFVSGYQAAAETPDGKHYLHAWPEVFLPGVGWCGWDPTHGVAVSDGHVRLCAAPTQQATMPVEGGFSFFGPAVQSTLSFGVQIQTSS